MINYNILNESIKHYNNNGFIRIESPWTVSEYVDSITRPENVTPFQLKHNDKCLVASGEQSFLYLYLKDFLPKGKFQTITPCFRFENFDQYHSKYFLKNELIITDEVNNDNLMKIIEISHNFFGKYLNSNDIAVVKTTNGYDLEYNNIELGSYGIRECDYLVWIYGTGCAEPRLSNILNKFENGIS